MIDHLYVENIEFDEDIEHRLSSIIDKIPFWRKEKVQSYKYSIDKYLCAKAYMLLKDGLSNDYGIYDEIHFSFNSHGKPFLGNHPEIHFNLSHCRKGVACAISSTPIGVDMEEIIFDDDIARYCFSEDEYKSITSSQEPAVDFTKVWTAKESYVKMLGCGLLDNMKTLNMKDVCFATRVERQAGYVVTTCSSKKR